MQHRHLKGPVTLFGRAAALLAAIVAGLSLLPDIARADLEFRPASDPAPTVDPLDDTPPGFRHSWYFWSFPNYQLPPDAFGSPTVSVTVDPITGRVRENFLEQDVEVREPLISSDTDYGNLVWKRNERRLWNDAFLGNRSITRAAGQRVGGLFRLDIPVTLPKAVQWIVGKGAPNLEVTGSETISLSGKSDWTANQSQFTGENRRQGAFPSFEMKQDLNVNLTGSIGDKIKVDVDQSSNVQTSVDNKVKLRYEGDDDDMIKSIELGNTNLSLAGASIRQEGLFGVKSAMKLGNVDLVTIASRQEGKNETSRFTPSGDLTHVIIRDLDYIKGQYFLISDHPMYIDLSKLEVWRDDANNTNNQLPARPGFARLDPTKAEDDSLNPQLEGHWDPLKPEIDYTVSVDYWKLDNGQKVPVLKLVQPLATSQMLAVSYQEITPTGVVQIGSPLAAIGAGDPTIGKKPDSLLVKMLRPSYDNLRTDTQGNFDPTQPWYKVLPYELRNFYYLQAANINESSMILTVRRLSGNEATPPDHLENDNNTPLIQRLGLDQQLNSTGDPGSDGRVDDRYVDSEKGILWFPDINPFDPNDPVAPYHDASCAPDSVGFNCLNYTRRNILQVSSDPSQSTANPIVYYRKTPDPLNDARYVIDAQIQSSRNGYFLGRFGILEGSETVRVNNVVWTRGTDYDIDYATGQLTFRRIPNPTDPVTVDYSFAQGAGQVSQTLAGISASYSPSVDQTVTSSFLYESKGAVEDLVKLGEEPATSMIGDLSTVLAFRPVWMTHLVNGIPGIRTSAPSNLNLQGSISTNIPNPNTKGEAYIDDMEGNRESNTLSLSRPQWFFSSVPSGIVPDLTTHAGIQWYNPANAVKEHDLRPVLSQAEGGENIHQVLEMNFLAPQADSTNTTSTMLPGDWNGVTQSLGTVGQDLTKTLYMEIWVNDFHNSSYSTPLQHSDTHAVLHMDFGRVDEDAFWDPKHPPNGQLDTEDKNGNGVLDRPLNADGTPAPGYEDTGLDGVVDKDELGYNPDTNKDPDGDDYAYDANKNANDYSKINNTEGNGIDAESRPDTEDLNRNGVLDRENAYFEASIDLSQDQFVAIDVPQLYGNLDVVKNNPNNGWRLFRIPISDSTFTRIGAGSWDNVQAVRFWVDGMNTPQKFQIGGIELVGNRWLRQAFRDSASYATRGVSLEVGSRNNKDDAGIYTAPYAVKDAVGSTATRREQSLSLAYKNLSPGDSVFAFKTYGDPGNGGFGWAEYQTLKFYVHGDQNVNVDAESLRAVARFGPDTLNYYEYSIPVRSGWQAITIPMQRLSDLKAKMHGDIYVDSTTAAGSQEVYAVRGNPSFTRISRVSFGLTVHGAAAFATPGEVWFDELRLGDVHKDRGVSSSLNLQANFADLMTLNASVDQTDKNYFRVGSGVTQGSGFDHTNLSLSSTFNLDRFLPTSGVVLPINVSAQHTTDVPKFRTGSDVILDPARSKLETRQFDRQSIGVSYHRSSPKKGLSRYTLDALSGDMNYSKQGELNPQASDSSWLFTMGGTYSIPIGFSGLKLGPMKVNPLPRTFQVQTNWRSSRDVLFSRTLSDTGSTDTLVNRSDVKQRLLSMRLDSRFEPLPSVSLTYTLGSARDMLLHQANGPFGWNKGTEISHDQTVTLNYRPRWLSLFNPDVTVTGTYREQASSERRDVPGLRDLKDITNQGNVRTNLTIPISRFGGRATPSKRDSIPTVSLLAPIRFFFGKWQDISASFDFQRSAALTRVTGDPGNSFRSGFTEVFDPSIRVTSSSTFGSSRRYHGTANTGFKPLDRLTFQIRGDYILSYTDLLYGERRNLSWSYPEVNANWSDLQRLLGLNGSISSLTLTSTFSRQRDESGPVGGVFEQRSTLTRFSPLLGWNATFRNGIRVNAQSNYETQDTEDGRAGPGYLQSRMQKGTSIEVNKNFPAARGIKLPWKKERIKLPNDLNIGARIDLSSSLLVRHQPTNDLIDSDTQSFRISSQNSYNFSAAMVGGFNLEYRQDVNKQLGDAGTRRGITIELNGTFRF